MILRTGRRASWELSEGRFAGERIAGEGRGNARTGFRYSCAHDLSVGGPCNVSHMVLEAKNQQQKRQTLCKPLWSYNMFSVPAPGQGTVVMPCVWPPWLHGWKSISKAAPPENSVTPSVSPPVVWTVCRLSLAGLRPPQRNMYPLMTCCEPLSVCGDREARPKLLPQRLGAHRGEG